MRGKRGTNTIISFVLALMLSSNVNAESNKIIFGLRTGVLNFVGDGLPEAPALMGEATLGLPLSKKFSVNLTGGFGKQKFSPGEESFFTQVASYDFYGMYRLRPASFVGPMLYLGVGAINFKRGTWPMYWDGSTITGGGLEFMLSQNVGLQVLADYRYTSGDDFDGVTGGGKDAYVTAKAGFYYSFNRSNQKLKKQETDPLLAGDIFDLIQKDISSEFNNKLTSTEKQKANVAEPQQTIEKNNESAVAENKDNELSDPGLDVLFGKSKPQAGEQQERVSVVENTAPANKKQESSFAKNKAKEQVTDPVLTALFGEPQEPASSTKDKEKTGKKLEPVSIEKESKPFPIEPNPEEQPLEIPAEYQQQLDERQAILDMLNVQLQEKEDRILALEKALEQEAVDSSNNQNFEEQYVDAVEMYQNRNYSKAAATFAALLGAQPDHRLSSNCQYWIGECAYSEGNYEQAIDAFKRTLQYSDSPKIDDALLMLGQSYRKMGNTEVAEKYYLELLQVQPDSEYAPKAKEYLEQSGSPVAYLDR